MDSKAVGERIQIAREERRLTQCNLAEAIGCTSQHISAAEAIGCTSQHISAIERGAKVPTLETFVAIAVALRVPTDVLLQDVLPDWWDNWEQEIDRVLAPLLPHMRAYFRKQIVDYHKMEESCSRMEQHLPQR